MANIKKNMEIWDSNEHWETGVLGDGVGLEDGEKWSKGWGSSLAQWDITILPRIENYTGLEKVALELAPGRGRWTRFLKDRFKKLILVELSPNCIEYCKVRFESASNLEYIVNDGRTLKEVNDKSIDFIFSFDSMVHVDKCDLESYITEFKRILKPKGVAFFHHSNLGQYSSGAIKSNLHLRAKDVSGNSVMECAKQVGFSILSQEYIPWTPDNLEEGVFLDCISILSNAEQDSLPSIVCNKEFLNEQVVAKQLLKSIGND